MENRITPIIAGAKSKYMKNLTVYIIVLIGAVACTPRPNRPDFVPDQEEMALLLADIYQIEAAISQGGRQVNRNDEKFVGYYKDVLDKHGITKLEFDSAVSWYSSYPELYSEVYDEVISTLSQRDALLKKELSEQNQDKKDMIDQIPNMKNLWEGRQSSFSLPLAKQDSSDVFFPFSIKVDSIKSGIIRLNASYKFNKGNQLDSAQMKMILCYADSTADTLNYQVKESFKKYFGNLSQMIPGGKPLVNIEGALFEHDTAKVVHVEIEDVKLTLIPKVSTEEMK